MKGLIETFWFLAATFMLCVLFDSINPKGWPKWAIPAELAAVGLFFAICKGAAKMADQERKDKLERERQERLERAAQLGTQVGVELALKQLAARDPEALRKSGPASVRVTKEENDGQPASDRRL